MSVTLSSYLIIQYLFLGFVILIKSNTNHNNRILAIAFFSIAVEDFLFYLSSIPSIRYVELLSACCNLFELFTLYFLCTYFYRLIEKKSTYFLVAPIIWVFIITLSYCLNGTSYGFVLDLKFDLLIVFYALFLLTVVYRNVSKYCASNTDLGSLKQLQLHYIRFFLIINILNIAVASIFPFLSFIVADQDYLTYFSMTQQVVLQYVFVPCQTILVLIITYILLQKPEVLVAIREKEYLTFEETLIKTLARPLDGRMKEERYTRIVELLVHELEHKHVYLNPDITVKSLSENINIRLHDVSYVVNRHYSKNFNGIINHFRIEHAKKMLMDQVENYTIYQIALESGFNTESVFYTTFKKATGHSPLEFKKKSQNNELHDSN